LRIKFGLPEAASTVNTRIVVLELQLDGEVTVIGGVADSVHEVIETNPGRSRHRRALRCGGDRS
jgi:purine-binding chemotaxis protein CheW